MKRFLIGAIIIFAASMPANAFSWDSALNFWNKVSESQAAQTQQINTLNDVEVQMEKLDKNVQSTFLDIVTLLSSKKEAKEIKSKLQDDNSELESMIVNYTKNLTSNKDSLEKTVKKLSSKNKTALVNDITLLAEESQNYLVLATNGIKAASNAMHAAQRVNEMATTLTNINRLAYELRTKASTVVTLANQLKTVASAAGLAVK